ncbi:MAG TPA: hypothetical protein VGF55_29555 [Gemmataceae bacterium]|jgi:hypothetical protein
MRRRAFLGVVAILVALFATTGTALALFARHVPAFYERSALPPGEPRRCHCRDFLSRSSELFNMMGGTRSWDQEFTQDQFNGYFQSQDEDGELSARIVEIPDEIKDVRVAFEEDLIRVGFRYGEGRWSCVVSVEFRVWLVAHQANVIALELCDFRAGALPLGTRSLIDFLTEAARRENIDVTWFRHGGHPIALLKLQANQSRPTFQLRRLEVHPGRFVIASRPTAEPTAPPAAALPPSPPPPDLPAALPAR